MRGKITNSTFIIKNDKLSEVFDYLTIGLKFAFKIFRASLQKETQIKDYYYLENVYLLLNNNKTYFPLVIHGLSIGKRSFVNYEVCSGIDTFNNNVFTYKDTAIYYSLLMPDQNIFGFTFAPKSTDRRKDR